MKLSDKQSIEKLIEAGFKMIGPSAAMLVLLFNSDPRKIGDFARKKAWQGAELDLVRALIGIGLSTVFTKGLFMQEQLDKQNAVRDRIAEGRSRLNRSNGFDGA